MNPKYCFLLFSLFVPHILLGQHFCEIEESSQDSLALSFSLTDKLNVSTSELAGVRFANVTIDGFGLSSEVGEPELPTLREWIEIPVCGRIGVEVVYEDYIVMDGDSLGVLFPVLPRQPSACKTVERNIDTVAIDRDLYRRDAFVGADLVSVNVAGTARDRRLAQIVLSPLRYNPVANKFVLYTRVKAVVKYYDIDVLATKNLALHHTPAYNCGVKTLNSLQFADRKEASQTPIRYLIVSHPMFRGYLDDFVEWKRSIGYLVDVAYTDQPDVGTEAQSIRAFVKRQYSEATAESPAPAYLLLVGDNEQLPAFAYSYNMNYYGYVEHVSDLNYACWTNDNIPDCFYGRLSAQSVSQLQHQLQKILLYERYEFPDPSFLDKAVLVAGVDGGYTSDYGYTHADPAMDYAAMQYLNGYHGFRSVKEFKNNASLVPHVPNVSVAPNGSEYAEYIRSLYSAGAGWINYSAHGQWNRWDKPMMSNDHVSDMANSMRCGVMIGNCCLTAKFDEPVCFAEALMRVGNHCGAAAYIGSSNSTYWNEDFYWAVGIRHHICGGMQHEYNPGSCGSYDHLFHTHGEDFSQWATTMGALMMSGNMSVENSTSDIKNYYWQIYHLFGDPSMMPWLSQAEEMPLSYSGADEGSLCFYVTTAPYAYAAVTDADNYLVGAAFANRDGRATIYCSHPIELGNMKLSSIAQGYKPRIMSMDSAESLYIDTIGQYHLPAMKIFPNPTAGMISVETCSDSRATLYSVNGRAVGSFVLTVGLNSLDISTIPAGVYFLHTDSGISLKIVKQ